MGSGMAWRWAWRKIIVTRTPEILLWRWSCMIWFVVGAGLVLMLLMAGRSPSVWLDLTPDLIFEFLEHVEF